MMNIKPTAIPHQASRNETQSTLDMQEQIHLRAYELFEQRGRKEGHELEDWLQAEVEVTQPKSTAVSA